MSLLARKVFPINALPAAQLAGAGIDELSHSADIKSRAVLEYYRRVPADLLFFFSDIVIQAEAMGARLAFHPQGMPAVAETAATVRVPRAGQVARMRVNAQVLQALGREFPDRLRATMVYGPFTVAGQVAGEQNVLRGVIQDPEEVHRLLAQCLDLARDYARLLLEAGADVLWVSDPLAALLPPAVFSEFAGDYLARLFAVKGDKSTALHICGDTAQILDGMLATGVGGISFDQCMSLLTVEDAMPCGIEIIGNLDPVEVLDLADPERVRAETAELAWLMGTQPDFTLSSGCAPPPFAPVENLAAFVESGRAALTELAPRAGRMSRLADMVFQGRAEAVPDLVDQALADGVPPMTVVNSGLMRAVKKGSALYEAKRCHLPDILMMVDAFYQGFARVEPLLQAADGPCQVVLGTVAGDIHEIGKNLVRIMLEAHGVKVLDLGVNVAAVDFVAACREHGASIVGLSCFITTARPQLEAVLAELDRAGLDAVKVVVGGAAASNTVAGRIGAHGFAPDAVAAVKLVQRLLAERRDAGRSG